MSLCAPICRGSQPASPGISPVKYAGTARGPAKFKSAFGMNLRRDSPYRLELVRPVRRTAEVTTSAAEPSDQYAMEDSGWRPPEPEALIAALAETGSRATEAAESEGPPTAAAAAAKPPSPPSISRADADGGKDKDDDENETEDDAEAMKKARQRQERELAAEARAANLTRQRRLNEMRAIGSWRRPVTYVYPKDVEIESGSESTEAKRMAQRVSRVPETTYAMASLIPASPGEAPGEAPHDDAKTPAVPVVAAKQQPQQQQQQQQQQGSSMHQNQYASAQQQQQHQQYQQ